MSSGGAGVGGVGGVVMLILVEDLLDLVLDFFDNVRHDD
jgi:hypothetical protein